MRRLVSAAAVVLPSAAVRQPALVGFPSLLRPAAAAHSAALGLDLTRRWKGSSSSANPRVSIPREQIDTQFSRSSGPGGQNVNKLNTKAELRFNLDDADWMDADTKKRLRMAYPAFYTNTGDFIVTSQRQRTQKANVNDAFDKLQQMVNKAAIVPKKRKMRQGLSEEAKESRLKHKRKRSEVKSGRGKVKDW